jgi:hydroxymethylbilane synthase
MRIGTRKSIMALAQTGDIARPLLTAAPQPDVEIPKFETAGDETSKPLEHGVEDAARAMKA